MGNSEVQVSLVSAETKQHKSKTFQAARGTGKQFGESQFAFILPMKENRKYPNEVQTIWMKVCSGTSGLGL